MNTTIKQKQIIKKRLSDLVGLEVDEFIASKNYFEFVFKGGTVLKIELGGRPKPDHKWEDGLDIRLDGDLILKTYDDARASVILD